MTDSRDDGTQPVVVDPDPDRAYDQVRDPDDAETTNEPEGEDTTRTPDPEEGE